MKKSLKLGLKIAGLSVALIPASVGALAFIDVPTTLTSKAPLNNKFFTNSVKGKDAADKPITQLAMLGSHDALSNGITISSGMDPYSPNTTNLSTIAKYVGPGAMVRLSRAQYDDIYTQLNAGVRYIDARITCINGQYYTHHTVISNTLDYYLEQILRWLNENKGEFIIFHIYYFNYEGLSLKTEKGAASEEFKAARDKAWDDLYTHIANYKPYGSSLFDYDTTLSAGTKVGDLTYNDVTDNGNNAGAVIYFSSDYTDEADENAWCYKHIYDGTMYMINPCANSMSASVVIDNVNKAVSQAKNKSSSMTQYIRYAQTQTTPNVDEVAKTITGWSLLQKAHEHNAYMLRKSGLDWNDIFNYVPIYMCDFCTDNTNGFCQELIDKMTTFNQNL